MKRKLKQLVKFTEDYQTEEEIILRDHLALERTKLANERTLLAYVRTSLYLLLGGIALIGLQDFDDLKILGYVALVLSIGLLLTGIFRYYQLRKHLKNMYDRNQENPEKTTGRE